MAVGRDVFKSDVAEITTLLISIQPCLKDEEDPQKSYLMSTWTKMAHVLQEDFAPFLPQIMPDILAIARSDIDVRTITGKAVPCPTFCFSLIQKGDEDPSHIPDTFEIYDLPDAVRSLAHT